MSHDFWGTPRTIHLVGQQVTTTTHPMNPSKTVACVFTESKEVWVTPLTPPIDQQWHCRKAAEAGSPYHSTAPTVDFRNFIVFFGAETLAHWNPTSCQKTSTIDFFGFETLKLKIRRLKSWKPTVPFNGPYCTENATMSNRIALSRAYTYPWLNPECAVF